jgi:hypothetical protein
VAQRLTITTLPLYDWIAFFRPAPFVDCTAPVAGAADARSGISSATAAVIAIRDAAWTDLTVLLA